MLVALRTSDYEILNHAGKISNDSALQKAHLEYEKYRHVLSNQMSAVEQHFAEAISKSKKLSETRASTKGVNK